MKIHGLVSPRILCLPTRNDKPTKCRTLQSLSLRAPPLSSIVHFSEPGKGQSRLQMSLFAIQANEEEGGPTLTEEYSTRQSPDAVRKEILDCYKLIDSLGRGAVYFGSARTSVDHSHYLKAKELAHEVALLLNCTSWTGAGPGLMDAVMKGAMEAKHPVGGFRIAMEGGSWVQSSVHPYLANETYYTCRFFSARKHGLVEAGVRNSASDRTSFICLPGGLGTLDEVFEIIALIQLNRLGSSFPVPFLILNYDGYYTLLLRFMTTCQDWGTIRPGEFESVCHVCTSNLDALEYLADFYGVAEHDRVFRHRLQEI